MHKPERLGYSDGRNMQVDVCRIDGKFFVARLGIGEPMTIRIQNECEILTTTRPHQYFSLVEQASLD